MQKKITGGIAVLFIGVFLWGNAVEASDEDIAYTELTAQVSALQKYIERNFLSHEDQRLSTATLRQIIQGAVQWLTNSQEKSGHFAYEYVPYEDVYLHKDNIVRQAGALYALGEIARHDPQDRMDVSDTIEKAITYFSSQSPKVTEDGRSFRCITDTSKNMRCQLGATSLALLGILGYLEQHPERRDTYQDLIDEYLQYILAMKQKDAGFRDMLYTHSATKRTKESPFSNGEALLALVRSYKDMEKPSPEIRAVIDNTFDYLENADTFENPLYLWVMTALKDMQMLWPNPRYIAYAKSFTDMRRSALTHQHHTDRNFCAVTEGLVGAYSILDGNISERELTLLRDEIDFWNVHNSLLQILPTDRYRLVLHKGTFRMVKLPDISQAQGGFLTSQSVLTQRIDFTQHCMNTYLQTLLDIENASLVK